MILLVGVAHVIDVRESLTRELKDFDPAAVAVELDPERLANLLASTSASNKFGSNARKGPMMIRIWAHMQRRLAAEFGDVPGAEMLVALSVAKEIGKPLFTIDDSMRDIAPRLLSSLTLKERVMLMVSSVFALVIPAKVAKKELKEYSEGSDDYVQAMRQQFPTVARVLLDERNEHMAARLKVLSDRFGKVAAVVGDAHTAGLEKLLKDSVEVKVSHLVEIRVAAG